MTDATEYTAEEFEEFDKLTNDASSLDQCTRIAARLAMPNFIKKHGREKCDAMFAKIKETD